MFKMPPGLQPPTVTTVIMGFSLLVSLTTTWGKRNQAGVFPEKPDRVALNSEAQLFVEHIWSSAPI